MKNVNIEITSQIWLSLYSPRGSRLLLTVPSNIVGSCGMMLSLDLRSCSPMVQMSTQSTSIWPIVGSTIRKRACIRVDLPLPVLPTIPVFMAPGKVTVRPFRTNGRCGAYLTCIKLKSYRSVLSRIIVIRIWQINQATICMPIKSEFLSIAHKQWQRYEVSA